MEPRQCEQCGTFTYNDDHQCPIYDGPVCSTPGCVERTLFYTVGAPGYGSGRVCPNRHYDEATRHGIYTPDQVR